MGHLGSCRPNHFGSKQKILFYPCLIDRGDYTAVPSVRFFGEYQGVPMIRINVREAESTMGNCVSLPMGAREALQAIDDILGA